MKMTNDAIKKYARSKGVRQYELADAFGMNESVMSRMFRYELDAEMQEAIVKMIDKLAEQKESGVKIPATALMRERILGADSKESGKNEVPQKKEPVKKEVQAKTVSKDMEDKNSLFEDLLLEEF